MNPYYAEAIAALRLKRECYEDYAPEAKQIDAALSLVGSAEEMLVALESVLGMVSNDGQPDEEGNVYRIDVIDDECEVRLQFARAAIAKAKGVAA
jgi:hypothetical protein